MSGMASGAVTRAARAARRPPLAGDALEQLALLRADPRRAVEEDSIRCLVCGGVFRQLTNTHLRGHDVSATEYKRQFGYNRGRPLMCRALQRLYVERAVKSGLAGRIRRRPILFEPALRRLGGCRTIALEEVLTRREARPRARGSSEGVARGASEVPETSDALVALEAARTPASAPPRHRGNTGGSSWAEVVAAATVI